MEIIPPFSLDDSADVEERELRPLTEALAPARDIPWARTLMLLNTKASAFLILGVSDRTYSLPSYSFGTEISNVQVSETSKGSCCTSKHICWIRIHPFFCDGWMDWFFSRWKRKLSPKFRTAVLIISSFGCHLYHNVWLQLVPISITDTTGEYQAHSLLNKESKY
jgi:hypothetical protein